MWDYHVHSSFSDDCNIDMEVVVKRAMELGIKEICFTDHTDFDAKIEGVIIEFDSKEYTHKIGEMKKKYGHKITIKKGVEMGYQPHIIERCNQFVEGGQFDFVLASLHTVEMKDVHFGDFARDKSPKQAYEKYFKELYDCIELNANFSVLAHYDLLKRYVDYDHERVLKENFDIIEATFKKIIYNGRGIEINTSGFRYNVGSNLPSPDFLRLYRDLGGEIITVGSDSHGEKSLGDGFDYTYDLLKKIGFKYITTFTQMQPEFIRI